MLIERAGWLAVMVLAGGGGSCTASTPQLGPAVSGTPVTSSPKAEVAPASKANGEPRTGASDAAPSPEVQAVALKTLGEHLSRPMDEITVVSVSPIDWSDSSLGCPQPDRGYLQVITPGYLAILEHGGQTYRVHMANGQAFVCERPLGEATPEKQLVPLLALPVEHLQTFARNDLARRLQVPADQVQTTEARPVVWRDASLGCPEPGQTYKPTAIKGYVLELTYHGRAYTYHTDTHRVIPCPALEDR